MNINHCIRKTIMGICAIMVIWEFGGHAATLPPDPDNAALLYYQAFLLCPNLDSTTLELRDKVLHGAEPDGKIREYMNQTSCRKMITLAEAASQIPECNWGILYSQGFGFNEAPLRHLYLLLAIDARIMAADGDYREAFDRCLTIRRLAEHIGDYTPFLYSYSMAVDGRALSCIQHVLKSMPPDSDILTWLQGQLIASRGASQSPTRALEMDLEFILQKSRTEHEILLQTRDHIVKNSKNMIVKKEIQSMTNEELLVRARRSYERFLNPALQLIESGIPYEKAYPEIKRLTKKLEVQASSDPVIILFICADQVAKMYRMKVRHMSKFNAIKTAIEIYLERAKTGKLPDTIPDNSPKDPYSGQDFVYEKTKEGFLLRCRVKDVDAPEVTQYEF